MKVYSAVVSEVVPVGFADLAQAADGLAGQEFAHNGARLTVHDRVGTGLAGAIRLGGTLRTSALLPSLKVKVVVSPWSASHSEVALHPITNLGGFDSIRSNRYFKAANSLLPAVVDRLEAERPVEAPVAVQLQLAA
jgi:hypothetical protein